MADCEFVTADDVKAWLRRGKYATMRIEELKERKRIAESRMTITSRPLEKRISRGRPSRGDDGLIAHVDYISQIDAEIAECNKTLTEISDAIRGIDGLLHRMVLVGKYVTLHAREKVADDIHRSTRQVDRIHNEAVDKLFVILRQTNAA